MVVIRVDNHKELYNQGPPTSPNAASCNSIPYTIYCIPPEWQAAFQGSGLPAVSVCFLRLLHVPGLLPLGPPVSLGELSADASAMSSLMFAYLKHLLTPVPFHK